MALSQTYSEDERVTKILLKVEPYLSTGELHELAYAIEEFGDTRYYERLEDES